VGWLVRAAQEITVRVNATVGFWLIVLTYVILALLEVGDAGRKVRAMNNREIASVLYKGSVASAAKFRRYLLIRTQMSAATGALVWALAALAGLNLALEWGVLAFALNYIPFIGSFIATLLPTLFALAQFESWQSALVVFACLNVIQFGIGSYIEPRLAGSALSMSPFVVLFAVFLWTFLWGLFGAFIGVPITIALLTFCAQHPSSRWLADLLGAPPDEKAVADGAAVKVEHG
jgi:predicted PurR-regulated permease PerM